MGYHNGMRKASPIARQRNAAGITQVELAERLGVIPGTVKRWEAGMRAPEREKMLALERILGVTASEILAHVDETRAERPRCAEGGQRETAA